MGTVRLPILDPIDYLIGRRFPGWTVSGRRINEGNPLFDFGEPDDTTTPEEVSQYEAELRSKSPKEIDELIRDEKDKEREELKIKLQLIERGMFYNQPNSFPDVEHWSRAAYWTLDEAVALSLGRDPRIVNWEKVKGYVGKSQFANDYARRRDLVLRASKIKQLFEPSLPGFFLAWCKRMQLSVPDELVEKCVSIGHQVADWKTRYDELKQKVDRDADAVEKLIVEFSSLQAERDELRDKVKSLEANLATSGQKPLSTRERDTAYKLIISLAIKGYVYDPKSKRSSTSSEIVADMAELGILLDEDTVRRWLQNAAQILPGDFE